MLNKYPVKSIRITTLRAFKTKSKNRKRSSLVLRVNLDSVFLSFLSCATSMLERIEINSTLNPLKIDESNISSLMERLQTILKFLSDKILTQTIGRFLKTNCIFTKNQSQFAAVEIHILHSRVFSSSAPIKCLGKIEMKQC